MNEKWDKRYLDLAAHVAQWSKDPRKKVGAIITLNNYIVGIGYNGFPRKLQDTDDRLNNQEEKLKLTIHAEMNAIRAANGLGDTIYTWPCLPCHQCLVNIMPYDITRIVTLALNKDSKWDPEAVLELCTEANIAVDLY